MLNENLQSNAGLRNRVSLIRAFPNRVWERGGRKRSASRAGFTLLELMLIMAILIILLAFMAPTLRHSFRQRGLDQEALRLLALTEYARDEAVSQGVPTQVWIDPLKGNYGAEAMPGYDEDKSSAASAPSGSQGGAATGVLAKQFTLPQDVHFEAAKSSQMTAEGYTQVIQFDPDGSPTPSTGINYIRILDEDKNMAMLTLMPDGWGYEITKEDANAPKH